MTYYLKRHPPTFACIQNSLKVGGCLYIPVIHIFKLVSMTRMVWLYPISSKSFSLRALFKLIAFLGAFYNV